MITNDEGIKAFTSSVKKPVSEASPFAKFLIKNFDRNKLANLPFNMVIIDFLSVHLKVWEKEEDALIVLYFMKKYNVDPSLGVRWLLNTPKRLFRKGLDSKNLIKNSENDNYYELSDTAYNLIRNEDKNDLLEEKILRECEPQVKAIGEMVHWKEIPFKFIEENIFKEIDAWIIYYYYCEYSLKEHLEEELYAGYFE